MSVLVARHAPDFTAAAVMPDGSINEHFRLSDLRGHYVVLFFWPLDFTWSVPLALAVLLPAAAAFFLGAAIVWLSDLPARRRGWSAQRRAAALQKEVDRIHAAEKAAAADRLAGTTS